jgi:hypothetical protein
MAIRKTGAVTGQVTGVEGTDSEGITVTGSVSLRSGPSGLTWEQDDDQALAGENKAADGE